MSGSETCPNCRVFFHRINRPVCQTGMVDMQAAFLYFILGIQLSFL